MNTFLDVVVIVIVTVAAIMQLAVIRDTTVIENPTVNAARWLICAGYAMLAVKFGYQMYEDLQVHMSDFSTVAVCLIGFGHIAFCWVRLSRT